MMDEQQEALYIFRKILYVLYLEIGALQPRFHPQVAAKAKLNTAFFQREKERQAASLYHQSEAETDPEKILGPYVERTGLDLDDIYRAFAEGDWRNKYGGYNYGGPKWIPIAKSALDLYHALQHGDWEEASSVVFDIKRLKTSQGYLINQFERTERRR